MFYFDRIMRILPQIFRLCFNGVNRHNSQRRSVMKRNIAISGQFILLALRLFVLNSSGYQFHQFDFYLPAQLIFRSWFRHHIVGSVSLFISSKFQSFCKFPPYSPSIFKRKFSFCFRVTESSGDGWQQIAIELCGRISIGRKVIFANKYRHNLWSRQ